MRTPILLAFFLLSASANAVERIVQETIPVNPDVRFSIESHRGELEITTGSVDAIEITVYIEHDEQEVVDEVAINIDRSLSDVAIEVNYDDPDEKVDFDFIGLNDYDYPEIRFVIVLPDAASLKVEAHRSQLEIAAPAGRVDIDTSRSTGRITDVRNDFKIVSTRGNYDIEIQDLHDVDVEGQRSNVRLDIFAATDFTLSGETRRGDVMITGEDVVTQNRERGERVDHVRGSGSSFVSFDVERGDLQLNFRN
ncbi:MAG: hypothetical protein AAB211_01450 [Pseudomonadota bacterium]